MPTTTQDYMESQEQVFLAAGPLAVDRSVRVLAPELVDEAVDRVGGRRRRVRQALGMPS